MKTVRRSIIPDGPREFRSFVELDRFVGDRLELLKQGKLAASLGLGNVAKAVRDKGHTASDDLGRVCLCGKPVGPRQWFCARCLKQHRRDKQRAKKRQGQSQSVV